MKTPQAVEADWDYLYFSDSQPESSFWQYLEPPSWFSYIASPKRKASLTKILAPELLGEQYQLVVTCDASMTVTRSLNEFISPFQESSADFAIARHPKRNCVYQEISANLRLGYDSPDRLRELRKKYRGAGMPRHYGLYGSRVMFHSSSPKAQDFRKRWAENYLEGSIRDQISLPYTLWELERSDSLLRMSTFDFFSAYKQDGFFTIGAHLKEKNWRS